MMCENEFCIFNRNFKCTKKDIKLDNVGNCITCILVDMPKEYLEKVKKTQLKKSSQKIINTFFI